jgi:hypothetical protein
MNEMKNLVSIRTNKYYSKEGEEYKKIHELVFLTDSAKYSQTNSGDIVRERAIEEIRFSVTDKGFEQMIDLLTKLKDAKEEDLV